MSTPIVTPPATPTPTKVEFTPEQQAHLQTIFDQRFAAIKSKSEEALKPLQDEVARLAKENEELKKKVPVVDPPKPPVASDAEREQQLALLRAEQANTAAAKTAWEIEKKAREAADAELAETRKNQAIRDAASHLEGGLEFHDLPMVTELVKNSIVLDKDTNEYVVKVNGVVKMNNSLQPMSLGQYFLEYATQRPYLVKSQAKAGAGSAESGAPGQGQGQVGVIRCKADFKGDKHTMALAKANYIEKFGLAAFENLPLR